MSGLQFHNATLEALHKPVRYRRSDIEEIEGTLESHGSLTLRALPSRLYAASVASESPDSGYQNVWVRDNVYVALAQWESGRTEEAVAVARALLEFYGAHRHRFDAIISGGDARDVMRRPHVRFNGRTLTEIDEQSWSHAQNDALGYFLWLCVRLASMQAMTLDAAELETLTRFPRYLKAIRYWEDEDSGHWEETRKVSASSIGVVVAALEEWLAFLSEHPTVASTDARRSSHVSLAADLIERGRRSLAAILPSECVQRSALQNRRYDAALIFLLYPLAVLDRGMSDLVLHDVRTYLEGSIGIRRYLGDSYWAPDYDRRLSEADRTRDYSEDIESRDVLLERIGDEAQWCIFDSLISAFHGRRFLMSAAAADLDAQTRHFNRALAQVTGDWKCPELYYRRDGGFMPNPHTPLQWSQANLILALAAMHDTAAG